MRQKDANMVAKIIGNEMRLASPGEVWGLETALGAVEAQMAGTDRNFNANEYKQHFTEGLTKGFSMTDLPTTQAETQAVLHKLHLNQGR